MVVAKPSRTEAPAEERTKENQHTCSSEDCPHFLTCATREAPLLTAPFPLQTRGAFCDPRQGEGPRRCDVLKLSQG